MVISARLIQNEMKYLQDEVFPILKGDHHPLTKKFIRIYLYEQENHTRERGIPIEKYSPYEPDLTDKFFEEFNDENKTITQIGTEILSNLIFLQSLPNANHRTSINFLTIFLNENDVLIKEYIGNESIIDNYIYRSSGIIKFDLVKELEKRKYFNNEDLEEKAKQEYLKKHLTMTKGYFHSLIQSGAPHVMPFKRLRAAFSLSVKP